MKKDLEIKAASVFRFLLSILAILILLNFASIAIDFYFNKIGKSSFTLKKYVILMFDFNGENNIPTYYNTFLLIASSGLLYYISKIVKKNSISAFQKQWFFLSCVFVFLALDELFMIHEILGTPTSHFLRSYFQKDKLGILYYSWIIPYVVILIFLSFYYFKFIFSLPENITKSFITAGVIFVSGAVGMEMIEGSLADVIGEEDIYSNIYFKLWVALEETLEMFGIIVFIRALISYLSMEIQPVNLILDLQFASQKDPLMDKILEIQHPDIEDNEIAGVN